MAFTTLANLTDGLQPLSILDENFLAVLNAGSPTTISLAGTDTVSVSQFGDILVNVAGSVTLNLPSAKLRTMGPISIIDRGGNAATYPITINPSGSETIMGQSSVQITSNYGSWTLWPDTTNGGWYTK